MEQNKKTRKPHKKKADNMIDVSSQNINCYVINEETGECIMVLTNTEFPSIGERIILKANNIISQWQVKQRTLVIDNDNEAMTWNITVFMVGSPRALDNDENIKKTINNKSELIN